MLRTYGAVCEEEDHAEGVESGRGGSGGCGGCVIQRGHTGQVTGGGFGVGQVGQVHVTTAGVTHTVGCASRLTDHYMVFKCCYQRT